MIKKIYLILALFLLILLPMSILKISAKDDFYPSFKINFFKDQSIGTLIINKINLEEKLYPINNSKNNVEEHVTILKESTFPDKDNSIMFLAAHSGEGHIAYFEELDNLKVNDKIKLIYKNHNYNYIIKDIWEEKKDGYININKEVTKQLILTTCSPKRNGYQLVINCILKESN